MPVSIFMYIPDIPIRVRVYIPDIPMCVRVYIPDISMRVSICMYIPALCVPVCAEICYCTYWSSVIGTITVDATVDTTSLVQFSLHVHVVLHFLLLIQLSLHLQAHHVQPSFIDHTVGVSVP